MADTPYIYTQTLRSVLADNPELISTLSRFEIPLGFGEKSVEQVCLNAGVDSDTFLAVLNLLSGKTSLTAHVDLRTLIKYLRNTHAYLIEFVLPRLRRDIIEAISGDNQGELTMMIMRFYDGFVEEVERHMREEDKGIFAQIEQLIEGQSVPGFNIDNFTASHHPMHAKLGELKEIFVCHYHVERPGNADLLNNVLHDIIQCGRDIALHGRTEEELLVPAVKRLVGHNDFEDTSHPHTDTADTQELTEREREVVAAIAHGLGNKQIADRLCVSVNTVTTHRRNICAKLDIHSPAGLTIYALLHGIIRIEDVRL